MSIKFIKEQLKTIPRASGIYKFFDKSNKILYVGKAKNLHSRVSSYTRENALSARISRMVFLANKIEIIQTESEVEALLLEHNLIKTLLPRFNILLRDDKTFSEILISDHKFPQISKYRGHKKNEINSKNYYFGPFASGYDVIKTIEALRKIFLLRICTDSEFKSRKKPCLEYQIKRCLAPCVGLVEKDEYAISVNNAIDFLKGKSTQVQEELTKRMLHFSEIQNYEKAVIIRDQIKALDSIQAKQNINVDGLNNSDVITIIQISDSVCIYVNFYRSSRSLGAKPYYFGIEKEKKLKDLLSEFLGQFYLSHNPPSTVILNEEIDEVKIMEGFLAEISQQKIEIISPKKGRKLELVKDQENLAKQTLERKISQNLSNKELLLEVKKIFNLKKMPQRIEIYDNSHTGNQNAVGCIVTAGIDGFIKSGYRKFNIKFEEFSETLARKNNKESIAVNSSSAKHDDTSMLKEVLTRRFLKADKKTLPDFIIIDGGKGQLSASIEIFDKLKIKIPFICMSKGEDRNAGEEYFHQRNKESFTLPKNSPTMYYLQRLRDEAHRFAIMTHRKKRDKNMLLG